MPRVEFEHMPDEARVFVFGADRELASDEQSRLNAAVNEYLDQWRAHGVPLVSAQQLRDNRFLAVAVDEAATGASGCSIDAFFRLLGSLEREIGTSMIAGGRVFWRNPNGQVEQGTRQEFAAVAKGGVVDSDTPVFDLTVQTVGDWRQRFEVPAGASWHARLIAA